jgi:hypothetical protein
MNELPPDYIEFRYETEIMVGMEDLRRFLKSAKENPHDLKWAVVSLFSVIYSAMALARGPESILPIKTKTVEKRKNSPDYIGWNDNIQLKNFADLYKELWEEENWYGTTSIPWNRSPLTL